MTRATTWTNSDGLVVGFGRNDPERNVAGKNTQRGGMTKTAVLNITYQSVSGASGAKVSLPAGSIVKNVWAKITETYFGGTSHTFGDATDPDGFIIAADWTNPVVNTVIQGIGAYAFVAAEGQQIPKEYTAAADLYVTIAGTYTAGKATIYVEYV